VDKNLVPESVIFTFFKGIYINDCLKQHRKQFPIGTRDNNHRSGAINIRNGFSYISLKKGVGDFPDVVCFFFYTLLKFDVLNAVSFH